MEFSARFKQLRKESGLTQQDIANVVFVDKTTVSKWELGANYPNQNVQTALADFFKVSVDYLLGRTDIRNANITPPSEAVIDMPIIGSVRGGMDGNVVQEETGETRPIAASALHGRPDEYFLLRVRGDSMYPEILDGDCVLVKKTDSVESGSEASRQRAKRKRRRSSFCLPMSRKHRPHRRSILPTKCLSRRRLPPTIKRENGIADTFLFGGDRPVALQSIRNRLDHYIELSGVKRIRIHGFRHSYVSMCAHLGATPVVIAHLIGDTIETVMQVYTHIWADDGSEIVLRINRLASETMAQNWHRL